MFALLLAAFLSASKSEVPPDRWVCANDIEVWCTVDSCAAKPESATTPMAISARRDGRFSVCAYTGCWEGTRAPANVGGRLVWAADAVPFSTNDAATADVSLMIVAKDGVGFVRVGAIASPLLCRSAAPSLDRAAE
jgi:hypothetical protein